MRIDKFLNATNLLKSRKIAQDMLENGLIKINSVVAKQSKMVKIGDEIEICFLEYSKKYRILSLPASKTTNKKDKFNFIEEI